MGSHHGGTIENVDVGRKLLHTAGILEGDNFFTAKKLDHP